MSIASAGVRSLLPRPMERYLRAHARRRGSDLAPKKARSAEDAELDRLVGPLAQVFFDGFVLDLREDRVRIMSRLGEHRAHRRRIGRFFPADPIRAIKAVDHGGIAARD